MKPRTAVLSVVALLVVASQANGKGPPKNERAKPLPSYEEVVAAYPEGVQRMVVGDTTRFWIPGELAYGNSARPGVPSGMLVFDIELLEILSEE